jgi:NAD(P)-dependent dehydrogenase (short-subunit alcohol dehydrogenase family)
MELGLGGRVVVVTGGGAGIGLATVEAFVAEGAQVVTADLDIGTVERISGVQAHRVDLLEPDAPKTLIDAVVGEHGRIDVLVNSLGALRPRTAGFTEVDDDEWRWGLEITFMVMMRACRAAIPHMQRAGSGSIVSIASDVARQPDPIFVDYSVAKAAVVSLSKSLSLAYAPGIRVNVVSPGPTRTPAMERAMNEGVADEWNMNLEEALVHFAQVVKRMPSRRLGLPTEVANAIVFLASDAASQVTGSEYCVNGGILAAA